MGNAVKKAIKGARKATFKAKDIKVNERYGKSKSLEEAARALDDHIIKLAKAEVEFFEAYSRQMEELKLAIDGYKV